MNEIPLSPNNTGFVTPGFGGDIASAPMEAGDRFASILTTTIGIFTVIAAIWFTVILLTGAVGIIGAGGNADKVAEARQRITNGLVGLIIVFATIAIVSVAGTILGFGSILDISGAITTLSEVTGIQAPQQAVPAQQQIVCAQGTSCLLQTDCVQLGGSQSGSCGNGTVCCRLGP